MRTSRLPGFHKLPLDERVRLVKEFAGLDEQEAQILRTGLDLLTAQRMVENVIGMFQLPLGIATNFLINGKEYLVPMVTEEPSVIAAASHGAKMVREGGGFRAWSTDPLMIGQIHVVEAKSGAEAEVLARKREILEEANRAHPRLVERGGGAREVQVRRVGDFFVVHLLIDVRDAMGANIVNSMCEEVAPLVEEITGGKVLLRILSNLCTTRLAGAQALVPKDAVGGEEVVRRIVQATECARLDPYRCATHNKGVMNGIVAVALATGNDTRAIEAGAHSFAALDGYKPLTSWEQTEEGGLKGRIEIPLAVGTVGGATHHPVARVCRKILGVKSARELAEVMASVGLAQNLAALRALVTEGIQRGHMRLHARNVAAAAGAKGGLVDRIVEQMLEEGRVSIERAKEILKEYA